MITLKYTGDEKTLVEQVRGGQRVEVKEKDVIQFTDRCGRDLLRAYPHLFVEAGAKDKVTIELDMEAPAPAPAPAPVETPEDVDVIDVDKLPKA